MPSTTYLLASLYTTAKTLLVRGSHKPRGSPQMNKVFRALGVPYCPLFFYRGARGRLQRRRFCTGPVSPMIDVEITPETQCPDDRPASTSICTFVFPPHFFLTPSFFESFPPPGEFSPRLSIRSRGSSGWIFNEAIYLRLVFIRTRRIFWESRISRSPPPRTREYVFLEFIILANVVIITVMIIIIIMIIR